MTRPRYMDPLTAHFWFMLTVVYLSGIAMGLIIADAVR